MTVREDMDSHAQEGKIIMPSTERIIRDRLDDMGAKHQYSGCEYAVHLILDCVNNNDPYYKIGGARWRIGKKFGTNASTVERAIRTFIKNSFSHQGTEKEFITAVASDIKKNIDEPLGILEAKIKVLNSMKREANAD